MAKKRYYQSPKDRLAESRGMEREMYAGYDDRKRKEYEDSMMIKEDRSAVANLPQNVMMKEYPKTDYYYYDLDDTQRGVNVQMDDDVRMEKKLGKAGKKYPEKY